LGYVFTMSLFFLQYFFAIFKNRVETSPPSHKEEAVNRSVPRIAIFAVFVNTKAELSDIERVLKLLNDKFDSLVLVNTGSRRFDFKLLNVSCFHRENYGRDIGSYKYALDLLNLESTSELLLINDSVLWTGNSVLGFLSKARKSNYQVTALTSSDQHEFHLQSYALHFKGNVKKLTHAFEEIRISNFKRLIVELGEKKISRYWNSNQTRIGGIYNQSSLKLLLPKYKSLYGSDYVLLLKMLSERVPLNPSIHLWAPLFEQSGVIKKSLILKNPARLKFVPGSLREAQTIIKLGRDLN
jgi:hypothetical protein